MSAATLEWPLIGYPGGTKKAKARAKVRKAKIKDRKKGRKLSFRFRRFTRKMRLALYKAGRKTRKGAKILGRYIATGAKATGRGALRGVGAIGWVLTGALKLIFTAVEIVIAIVAAVLFAATFVLGALIAGLAYVLGMLFRGITKATNWAWDGSRWMVKGRPGSFKSFHKGKKNKRDKKRNKAINKAMKSVGVEDFPVEVAAPAITLSDEAVRLRVYDEDRTLVQERYFPNAGVAAEFLDERYSNIPVVAEMVSVDEVVEEIEDEVYTEEEKKIKAEQIAAAMLGVELLGTEEENDARIKEILEEDLPVPSSAEVADAVSHAANPPEVVKTWGAPLTEEMYKEMEFPRNEDWAQYLSAELIPVAYAYFAERANTSGNKKDYSYWTARAWMRLHHIKQTSRQLFQNPAEMHALFLKSGIDTRTINQNETRLGIRHECQTIKQVYANWEQLMEEQDRVESGLSLADH